MSDISVHEWRQQALAHRRFLEAQIESARQVTGHTKERVDELRKGRDAARFEAAAAFLPSFDPMSLELCERLANMTPGWAAQQQKKVHDEDVALAARIGQIEHDEHFQRREALLGPEGEWKTQLADAEKQLAPHQANISRYERLPSWKELIETGYGTPEYSVKWYHLRYYRLWKHADEACEASKQEPFELLRQLYLQEVEQRDKKKVRRDEAMSRVQNLTRLVNERDQKVARREALRGPAPLDESRQLVGQWLANANRRSLGQMLQQAGRADLLNALVKLDAIETKSAYLESTLEDDLVQDLVAEQQKLDGDLAKYARPKKAGTRFAMAAVQKRFQDRPARFQRRIDQRRAMVDRIYDWDDYDDVNYDDWGQGVPWWFLFTGRSDPGYGARFYDVGQWSAQQPGWSYVRRKRTPLSAMDDAAAALANQQVDDGGRDVS